MNKILQFKISLKGSKPLIWRRFQVESNKTFYDLHLIIQIVMGWTNTHLYHFYINKNYYIGNADSDSDDLDDMADDKNVRLSEIFAKPKSKAVYEYDFGDGWQHDVQLEKILDRDPGQNYPVCLKGELNCPPEDCGGIGGFYFLIEALKDKKNPEHKSMTEWLGGNYDPEYFDLDEINELLKNYKDYDLELN